MCFNVLTCTSSCNLTPEDSLGSPGNKYPVQDTNACELYTLCKTGIPENHTLSSGTSPYGKYRGVPPPPSPGYHFYQLFDKSCWCLLHCEEAGERFSRLRTLRQTWKNGFLHNIFVFQIQCVLQDVSSNVATPRQTSSDKKLSKIPFTSYLWCNWIHLPCPNAIWTTII